MKRNGKTDKGAIGPIQSSSKSMGIFILISMGFRSGFILDVAVQVVSTIEGMNLVDIT